MKHFVGLHVAVKETAICIDARHMKAAVSAMPVKTDRIDARNIAFAMQVGWYRPVHLKRPEARKLRLLLSSREMLVRKRIDEGDAQIRWVVGTMLTTRAAVISQLALLQRAVLAVARHDQVCCRLMTCPALGAVTALAFKTAVDEPARFPGSAALGAFLGL